MTVKWQEVKRISDTLTVTSPTIKFKRMAQTASLNVLIHTDRSGFIIRFTKNTSMGQMTLQKLSCFFSYNNNKVELNLVRFNVPLDTQ